MTELFSYFADDLLATNGDADVTGGMRRKEEIFQEISENMTAEEEEDKEEDTRN